MAKQLANVVIEAPGFFGVNTEDSPSAMVPAFAKVADNCVVDNHGRISSRKGLEYITTTGGTDADVTSIFEFVKQDGTTEILSAGANKIYSGTTTLTDETGALSITADDWQIVQLDDEVHFFQAGHEPLVYDAAVGTVQLHSAHSAAAGTPPQANCAAAGFGRVFAAGVNGLDHVIYWTDLLIPTAWDGGTSGSLDTQKMWPGGHDTIEAIAIHNDFLVVFGERNILLYSGAKSPATMQLQDTIAGIGCSNRDSIVNTGNDLLFLDATGYRSLGRTVQEKSSPIGRISRNINTDLRDAVSVETQPIKAVFDRKNSNILLMLPANQLVACFDSRLPLEDGSYRCTWWTGTALNCGVFTRTEDLYFGAQDGIKEYSGLYTDEGTGFVMRYYSWAQDFGEPTVEKMPKGMDITSDGGSGLTLAVKYAYDYNEAYKTVSVGLPVATDAEFGIDEFGIAEYSGGIIISRSHVNLTGRGRTVSIGIEATINGDVLAIQEMNVHSILGRMI